MKTSSGPSSRDEPTDDGHPPSAAPPLDAPPTAMPPLAAASFLWRRFIAFLLDVSLLAPIGVLAAARIWTLLAPDPTAHLAGARDSIVTVLMVAWLAALGVQSYNRWWRQGTTGQSWGKRMMRLRLVAVVGGSPIGPRAAFLRDILNGFIAIGPALALIHPLGQTLGDMAVGAIVREEPPRQAPLGH
jgi:uncharacterized RDD family membrane protein YckC